MKNLFVLLLTLATSGLFAQQKAIERFFNQYQGVENATHLNISGNMLEWISNAKDENGDYRFASRLKGLRVLSLPSSITVDASEVLHLRQSILANRFEELIRVRDGKELVNIYLLENNQQVIEEVVILVEGETEFTLVSLTGELYREDLHKLEIEGDAGDMFRHIPDDKHPRP
ncbi:MAG: DUF4252 domain-containing protein [Saprospiraceae bacterium]